MNSNLKSGEQKHFCIHITDPWSAPDAGSYAGSDEWVYHATYPFYGAQEEAVVKAKEYVRAFREENGPYLASVVYWLTE